MKGNQRSDPTFSEIFEQAYPSQQSIQELTPNRRAQLAKQQRKSDDAFDEWQSERDALRTVLTFAERAYAVLTNQEEPTRGDVRDTRASARGSRTCTCTTSA